MKLSKIILNTFISFTSVFLGIFICELSAKRIGLGNPILYKDDNLVGYRLRPNQSLVRRKGANITTDSEGFRIDNKKIVKEDTKFIVFVGDSVTYGGSYIDNENLFSSKYCNLIYDKNISCLNSGINAWGLHNMSRLISNYDLYSSRKPIKFILVILPGDEGRNFKAFSDTPFWSNKPKQPSAINEIIKFINSRYFLPALERNSQQLPNNVVGKKKEEVLIQKKVVWDELKFTLEKSKYPIDIVITPPRRWFENQSAEKEIKVYDEFLTDLSKLKTVNKTCNLYKSLKDHFEKSLYVDGVHLTKKGHEIWAEKIFKCIQ